MAETKYGKYIITQAEKKFEAPWEGEYKPDEIMKVIYLDNSVLKGAFYVETAWFLPPVANRKGYDVEPHLHDFDEVLAVFGTDLNDPSDLGAELEFFLGDERHVITKSCLIFIPKGLKHGPIRWLKMNRPVFHFATGPSKDYLHGGQRK